MPALTANRAYPYATAGDPADVPFAMQALAEAIDDDVCQFGNGLTGRPVARYRGVGTYASPSPSQPLTPPPTDSYYRVPFTVEDFDTIGCSMQSQEAGNRLIFPASPGFYFAFATVYVPTLTLATTVTFMGLQIRRGIISNPLALASRIGGTSNNVPVDLVDSSMRLMTIGVGIQMDGVDDALCVEWRADTNPDVAEYVIGERTLTILKMTQV